MIRCMTSNVSPRPVNPIQQRKDAVRKYSRNAVVSAGGGIAAGVVLGLLAGSWVVCLLCVVVGVGLGWFNWSKVQKIVNYRDPQ